MMHRLVENENCPSLTSQPTHSSSMCNTMYWNICHRISKLIERLMAPDQENNEAPVMLVDTKENDQMFIIIESHDLASTPCSNITSKDQLSMPDELNFVLSTQKGDAPVNEQSFLLNNESQGNHGAGKSRITTPSARAALHMEPRLTLSARGVFQSTRRRLANQERENKICRKLTCSTCSQVFHSRAILSRHFRTKHHSGVKCKQTRTSKQTAERLFAGEKEGRITLACESCGKCYRSAQCLAMHQLAHRGIKPFLCDSCGRGFHAQATLDRHVMLRHTDRRPFVCDRCGKGFVASSRLARHVETHDPTARGRYACETCGADFANAGNLLRHRRLHSSRPRPYSCDKCGKSFTQKTSLSAHSAVHDLEARRVTAKTCPICGKTLSKAANLDRHIQQLHHPRRRQALISEATSTSLRNDVQTALAAEDDFEIGREDTTAFDEAYVFTKRDA